ncbi:hypothetical protein ACH4FX_04655 [Streptomyces sp. NPDC018019]|uniref:hypothetical protein n=1 Tax=Streptomyces sp. NPDC018019 TaxID=3365030 RepID=UPI00378C127A
MAKRVLPECRSSALARLGRRTEEAEAEARRAYNIGQGHRWYRHNPNVAVAVNGGDEGGRRGPGAHR